MPTSTSHLEIHLGRIEHNARALRGLATGGTSGGRGHLCAAIKKNAYGLGAIPVAKRLIQAGCDMLAVYSADEAAELVAADIHAPILIFHPPHQLTRTDALYPHAAAGLLHLTIHEPREIDQLERDARALNLRLHVHLYLDTGMSRGGLNREQFTAALKLLPDCPHLHLAGIYSHLAGADDDPDFTREQLRRFHAALNENHNAIPANTCRHIANTFGTLRDSALHLDMIRPGLGLLGFGPELMHPVPSLPSDFPALQPAVRWISRIVHIQRYLTGTPVGYGSTCHLMRPSILGVVPAGYGDGYPLALSNKATVRVYPENPRPPGVGFNAPVLGRVNMDQIIIDLTDTPSPETDPASLLHAPVDLISDDPAAPNSLPHLAALASSHCYEMLCRLSPRLPRQYVPAGREDE